MHGNVWQWIEDCYHENYEGAPQDGSAWIEGVGCFHVIRGGSWANAPGNLRSAFRKSVPIDARQHIIGFRVGRALFSP